MEHWIKAAALAAGVMLTAGCQPLLGPQRDDGERYAPCTLEDMRAAHEVWHGNGGQEAMPQCIWPLFIGPEFTYKHD